jgi:hypothetical protein
MAVQKTRTQEKSQGKQTWGYSSWRAGPLTQRANTETGDDESKIENENSR